MLPLGRYHLGGYGELYVLGLFEGSFGLFNAYLVVFGLFLPKTEEKRGGARSKGLVQGLFHPSDLGEELNSLLEVLDSLCGEATFAGKVLTPLGFSSMAVPEVFFPTMLARCATTASDVEELHSPLEKLNSLLEELNSLGEVLGAGVWSRGLTAPSDWYKEFDLMGEDLNSLCEELTSPGRFSTH